MDPVAMVTRSFEWFGHVKIRHETENIREVANIKEGNRKTKIEMKEDYQKGHESMEGIGH